MRRRCPRGAARARARVGTRIAARFMPHGLVVLAALAAYLEILHCEASMSGGRTIAHGVDNLLAAESVRKQLAEPGVQPIRIEADFVTCTQ